MQPPLDHIGADTDIYYLNMCAIKIKLAKLAESIFFWKLYKNGVQTD